MFRWWGRPSKKKEHDKKDAKLEPIKQEPVYQIDWDKVKPEHCPKLIELMMTNMMYVKRNMLLNKEAVEYYELENAVIEVNSEFKEG